MEKKINESIFDGDSCLIPMADVSFIEKHWMSTPSEGRNIHNWDGLIIIMKYSFWNMEADTWAHNAYLSKPEAEKFMSAWKIYRNEFEGIG